MNAVPTTSDEPKNGENGNQAYRLNRVLIWMQGVVLLVAAVGTTWLLIADLSSETTVGLPGCGGKGGGCNTLLHSGWSKWLGIPVSYWGGSFLSVQLILWGNSFRTKLLSLWLMAAVSWSALGVLSAAWFFYVMKVVVGEYCPLCLTAHSANTIYFFLTLARLEFSTSDPAGYLFNLRYLNWKALSFLALLGQVALIYGSGSASQLEIRTIDGVERPLSLAELNSPEIQTIKGNPNGQRTLVIFTCLTCPACRQVNRLMSELQQQGQLTQTRIEVRFFPLSSQCNPQLAELAEQSRKLRSDRACELARISLAVADANPDRFSEWIDTVYEIPSQPITEFEQLAREWLGSETFEKVYRSARVQQRLENDLKIAGQIHISQVPQLLTQKGMVSGQFSLSALRGFLHDD